jgi:hypothetical protein
LLTLLTASIISECQRTTTTNHKLCILR